MTSSEVCLFAVLAGTLEEHLRHRRDSLTLPGHRRRPPAPWLARSAIGHSRSPMRARPGCDRHVDVVQTRHLAATGADEVRMIPAVSTAILMPPHLEPPNMVTEVDPRHKLGLGEFREVAVDGGPIEAAMIERRRHLGMRLGPRSRQHVLQDHQPGGRAPKPCPTNEGFHGIDRFRFWRIHVRILPLATPATTTPPLPDDRRSQLVDNCRHKRGQVSWFATGHKVAVDHDRCILPDRPGIHQVILDPRAAGHPDATVHAR